MSVYIDDDIDDLIPCPFCKSSNLSKHKADYNLPTINIVCETCGTWGPDATDFNTAEELWNARRIEL